MCSVVVIFSEIGVSVLKLTTSFIGMVAMGAPSIDEEYVNLLDALSYTTQYLTQLSVADSLISSQPLSGMEFCLKKLW